MDQGKSRIGLVNKHSAQLCSARLPIPSTATEEEISREKQELEPQLMPTECEERKLLNRTAGAMVMASCRRSTLSDIAPSTPQGDGAVLGQGLLC